MVKIKVARFLWPTVYIVPLGVSVGVESCTVMFLWMHWLIDCVFLCLQFITVLFICILYAAYA